MSTVTIRCKFLKETDKASEVADLDDGCVYWIPLSQVERRTRDAADRSIGTITMSEWIAREKAAVPVSAP